MIVARLSRRVRVSISAFRDVCSRARFLIESWSGNFLAKSFREYISFRRIRLGLSDPFNHARAIAGLFRKQEFKTRAVSRLRIADNNTVRVRSFSLPWKRKGKAALVVSEQKNKAQFISQNFAHILRVLTKIYILKQNCQKRSITTFYKGFNGPTVIKKK